MELKEIEEQISKLNNEAAKNRALYIVVVRGDDKDKDATVIGHRAFQEALHKSREYKSIFQQIDCYVFSHTVEAR